MSQPPQTPQLIYCRCAYAQVLPPEVKDGVLQHLCLGNRAFESVADLCEMSARRDPRLAALADSGPLQIVACHPRAVRWLFHAASAPLPEHAEIVNLRSLTLPEAIARIDTPEAS